MIDISHLPTSTPLKVIIGAGRQSYPGWIATNKEQLDLCQRKDWVASFSERRVDALLCEHVWEHLTESEGRCAASICYEFLKPGGFLRCAVPDANFPNEDYQRMVQVGGPGPADHPGAGHKIVYDYKLFSDVFTSAGFKVDWLEYCDETGRFHYNQWSLEEAPIYRSLLSDHRNKDGKIGFTSLIIDAIRP
jgi:predicted SAM-dependent methyltransferase